MRAILYLGVVLVMASGLGAQKAPARPPIIDVHLHTYSAALGAGHPSNPVTGEPGPASAAEHRRATLAAMEKYNIVAAIVSGHLEEVDRWHSAAPTRILGSPLFGRPGVEAFGEALPTIEFLRSRYREGRLKAMAEVTAQYEGLSPSDPALDQYFALAEEVDVPVGIHTGTSFPGTPFSGSPRFRVALGNPLLLEDLLVRRPKLRAFIMHGGEPWRREMFASGLGKRIMFGTDQMNWSEAIGMAIESIEPADFLSEQQKRDLFYNNAARFLRLERPKAAEIRPMAEPGACTVYIWDLGASDESPGAEGLWRSARQLKQCPRSHQSGRSGNTGRPMTRRGWWTGRRPVGRCTSRCSRSISPIE